MEFELISPQQAEIDSVWDKDVPIVQSGRTWDCYVTDQINNPASYNELCYMLDKAYPCDTFNLHLNCPGGVIDSAFQIIDSLQRTKAATVAHLSGTVASAGTMIALSCQELHMSKFAQFMIHNYSGGTSGKGHEVRDYVKFSDKQLNIAFTAIYLGFLTDKEIHEVIEGKDLWMDRDEVLLRYNNLKESKCSTKS